MNPREDDTREDRSNRAHDDLLAHPLLPLRAALLDSIIVQIAPTRPTAKRMHRQGMVNDADTPHPSVSSIRRRRASERLTRRGLEC